MLRNSTVCVAAPDLKLSNFNCEAPKNAQEIAQPTMASNALTSEELNYMIFRYLQESSFLNAAFNFGHESGINNAPIYGTPIPPATLIRLVHKGLQYIEMEANLINDPGAKDEDFCFLETIDLITKDISELQKIVEDKKKSQPVDVGTKENEGGSSGVNDLASEVRRTELNCTRGARSRRTRRRGRGGSR